MVVEEDGGSEGGVNGARAGQHPKGTAHIWE